MRKFLYIATIVIASLACMAQSTLPAQIDIKMSTATPQITETAQIEMARVVGSWNLREAPGESSLHIITLTDVEVQLIDCVSASGGVWCKVSFGGVTGWVNKKGLK